MKSYDMVKDGSIAIFGTAALILTINFGIISFGIEKSNSSAILISLRVPIIASGSFLIASLVSGGFNLAILYSLVEAIEKKDSTSQNQNQNQRKKERMEIKIGDEWAVRSYRLQTWTFIAGTIFMFWGVLVRLGL